MYLIGPSQCAAQGTACMQWPMRGGSPSARVGIIMGLCGSIGAASIGLCMPIGNVIQLEFGPIQELAQDYACRNRLL